MIFIVNIFLPPERNEASTGLHELGLGQNEEILSVKESILPGSTVEDTSTVCVQGAGSTVEDTCTVHVQEEIIKRERTDDQGKIYS